MREFLKGLELDKETIDTIMAEHGKLITESKEETSKLEKEIKTYKAKIEDIEKAQPDVEKIKQEQFNLGKVEGTKELETFKKEIALKEVLSTSKAKDIDLLTKLIDNEKLSYEEKDGKFTITGLDEQLKNIKENKSFLFEEEKKEEPGINLGGEHNGQPPANEPADLASALKEKYGN